MPLEDTFRLRCDPSFKAKLKAVAKKKRRSMSAYTLDTLTDHVDREEAKIIQSIGHAAWSELLRMAESETEEERRKKKRARRKK